MKNRRKLTCIGQLCMLLWAVSAIAETVMEHKFGIDGKAVLCVPSSDINKVLMPYNDESINLEVGSGHTPGFAFEFSADEIQRSLFKSSFKVNPLLNGLPHINELNGSIGFLSDRDANRLGSAMRARDFEATWTATGDCNQETVKRVGNSELFEVKCRDKDDYSSILNRVPNSNMPMPDPNATVVATCVYDLIPIGKYAGQQLRSCRRVAFLAGFIVDYQIQEYNVPLYDQIDHFLERKIAAWRQRCALKTQ